MRDAVALWKLSNRRLAELFGMRTARIYALGIGASFALILSLSSMRALFAGADALLHRALGSASWVVGGLSALSAARDLARRDHDDGVSTLACLRGYDARSLELSRVLAAASRIGIWVGGPCLALLLLPGAHADGRWRLDWAWFIPCYALALGLALGTLSRVSARLSPRHGRLVLVAFILLPELFHLVLPAIPSLPRAFEGALASAVWRP